MKNFQSKEVIISKSELEKENQSPELESDIDFAHIVASCLNNLIDARLIKADWISNASPDRIEEFICRFEPDIAGRSFERENIKELTSADKELLSTFFFSESDSHTFSEDRIKEKEEDIKTMRSLLQRLQNKFPELMGFVLYGSRMDVTRKLRGKEFGMPDSWGERRGMSDIDSIAVINSKQVYDFSITDFDAFEKLNEKQEKIEKLLEKGIKDFQ